MEAYPTETLGQPGQAPAPKHHLYPAVASWQHAGWFKAAMIAVIVVGATWLGVYVTPWIAGLIGGVAVIAGFTVAEVVLRRKARGEGGPIPVTRRQPIPRRSWLSLAVVVLFGAAFVVGMGIDGRWLVAILGGVVFPVGSLIDWWFLRRASSEAARVADYNLNTVWLALFLLGWFMGAWDNLP